MIIVYFIHEDVVFLSENMLRKRFIPQFTRDRQVNIYLYGKSLQQLMFTLRCY